MLCERQHYTSGDRACEGLGLDLSYVKDGDVAALENAQKRFPLCLTAPVKNLMV
jgi:hypothetical protein